MLKPDKPEPIMLHRGKPETPYTLELHLATGQMLTVDCISYDIRAEGEADHHGNVPLNVQYTVPDGWRSSIIHLNPNVIVAVVVHRSEEEALRDP